MDYVLDVFDIVLLLFIAQELDLLGELLGGNHLDVVELGRQERVRNAMALPILLLLLQDFILKICFEVAVALGSVELINLLLP